MPVGWMPEKMTRGRAVLSVEEPLDWASLELDAIDKLGEVETWRAPICVLRGTDEMLRHCAAMALDERQDIAVLLTMSVMRVRVEKELFPHLRKEAKRASFRKRSVPEIRDGGKGKKLGCSKAATNITKKNQNKSKNKKNKINKSASPSSVLFGTFDRSTQSEA